MKTRLPDYKNSGLNVAASMLAYGGAKGIHDTLPVLNEMLAKAPRKVVLFLFDGMGMAILRRHMAENSYFRAHVKQELSAVYPSTTTAATTTLESGDAPIEHGWLGWTLYFDEIMQPVDVFINTNEKGEQAADYNVAERFIPYRTLFDKINAAGQMKACHVSPFGDVKVKTADEMFDKVRELCADDEKRYIYAYCGEPDHTMHMKGCGDEGVKQFIEYAQEKVKALKNEFPDALVMVTADHGLLDVEAVYVSDHPKLMEMLVHRPTVETRMAAFHVKAEYKKDFPKAFEEAFGKDDFMLLESAEAVQKGFFGSGEPHRKSMDFLGDYVAMALERRCIYPDRDAHLLVAMHAGLTEDEMRVPLIVAE